MMTITVDDENVIMDIDRIDNTESTIVKRLNLCNFGLKSLGNEVHKHLPHLEELNAANNELENINFCSNQLTKLDCRNNKLSDVIFVQHLPNLQELCLSGNPLCLADYYIAATLCPKLKIIDGEPITFDVCDINKEFDRRLWPQILHVWETKFEKHFSTKLKDDKSNKLIEQFIKRLKSKKLYTQKGLEKFTDFKVKQLIGDLLTEQKSQLHQSIPSKTYEKTAGETEMLHATLRSSPKGRTRNSSGASQRGKNVPNPSENVQSVRTNKEKHKIATDRACPAPERKHKNARKVIELWPRSTPWNKVDTAETNLAPSALAPVPDSRKKSAGPKLKKPKIDDASTTNNDDDPDGVFSESDVSLTTATDRALNFIASDPPKREEKRVASFKVPSALQQSRPTQTPTGQKHPAPIKGNGIERKSRIPAPITRFTRSRTMTSLLPNATTKMMLRNTSLPVPPNKHEERVVGAKKNGILERTTAPRSIRSSRALRDELAVYKDIENWCEDVDEHFVPERETPPKIADKTLEAPKSGRTIDAHARATRATVGNRFRPIAFPESTKSSTEKPFARKCSSDAKKARRRAPLIVSGDEESLDLDPSVHPSTTKPKRGEMSESGSSENADRNSSNVSWGKKDSDSDFTASPAEEFEFESDTDEEVETANSKYRTRWSRRLEAKEKEKELAPVRRCLRGNSKLDDVSQLREQDHERRELRERDREQDHERRELRERDREQDHVRRELRERDREQDHERREVRERDRERDREQDHERRELRERDREQDHERREVRERDGERVYESREVRERGHECREAPREAPREARREACTMGLGHQPSISSWVPNISFEELEVPLKSKSKTKSNVTRWGTPPRRSESLASWRKCESGESPRTKLAEKKSRLPVEERTSSLPSLMERDWNPLHFLKCHSADNSDHTLDNDKTQVWHCAFEPDTCDNRSHLVATCGGQTVCLIDCESGRVMNRYKHGRSSEEFFTLAWTTLQVEDGREQKVNILAVGGKRGMILLLQPNHLVCYAELSGHKDMISGLNFHPHVPEILCSGSTDGTIIVWDIGIPKGKNYETEWRNLHIIKVQYDVLNVLFVPQVDFLLAGTENSCWGWRFDSRDTTLMTKVPNVEFVHPTKVSGRVQMESVIDAIVLVSKNVVASKCAGYKCIYLWDIRATVLSTVKKLTRGARLNIQVLAILQWSDNDNFYLNMGCSKESQILACGDASGKLWIYQLHELLANRQETTKSHQQVVSPVILIEWPECRLRSNNKNPEKEVNLNNVVINSVSVSSDARYITAVTDKNIVCIWN